MGFISTTEPEFLRKKLNELKIEILNDEYLKDIPSMSKTRIAFHAKDDCPEVRYKVFTLLKDLPFSCNIVVARKTEHVFKKFNGNTQELYDSLITNLFKKIVDYCNWAVQRAFLQNDMRYYRFLKEKFGLIVDLYDYKKGWKNFYSKKNPFDIKKISPLRLGIKKYSQHEADFRT